MFRRPFHCVQGMDLVILRGLIDRHRYRSSSKFPSTADIHNPLVTWVCSVKSDGKCRSRKQTQEYGLVEKRTGDMQFLLIAPLQKARKLVPSPAARRRHGSHDL